MSAKSFITGLILLLFVLPASLLAGESKDSENKWNHDFRSISYAPSLSINDNAIYISSDKQLDSLCIQIKDATGNILFSDIVTILPEQEYIVSLNTLPQGEYQIQLTQGANYLTENFFK